jgi:metallopeptidase MepB
MLENFCSVPSVLKSMSCHYSSLSPEYLKLWKEQSQEITPPEKIPDTMIENLLRAKKAYQNSALWYMRALNLSIFDLLVHQPESHEAIENMRISAEWNKLRKAIHEEIDGPEVLGLGYDWGHGQHLLGNHLMGEYDAGYYSYL